ncbi:MAG: hypothetical protein KPEEDBHJ_03059 [Anaerolineales bacterium]|nr:hypothetical protein [Anaerolineales bacterium]
MNKLRLPALLVAVLVMSLSCSIFSPATSPITTPLHLTGTATNTTASRSSGVSFNITTNDNVTFYARGSFDSVNLFGRFDTSGKQVSCENSQNVCFNFSGDVFLGDDGSGYPTGTVTTYEMNIIIDKNNNATGTYIVGKLLPNKDYKQFGVLDLSSD